MNAYQRKPTSKIMPITQGIVGSCQATGQWDTGCSSVVEKKPFMKENKYTGTHGYMLMAEKNVRKVPQARTEIDTPYYVGKFETVCLTASIDFYSYDQMYIIDIFAR